MARLLLAAVALSAFGLGTGGYAEATRTDIIPTSEGNLKITLIGHGTLMFEYGGKIIHIDPWTKVGNYSSLPKADLVLITHHHRDHLDPAALKEIIKDNTIIVMTQKCSEEVKDMGLSPKIMANGDKGIIGGFSIEAIPAYNLVHKRENGGTLPSQG